jgi:putative ABC transport system substrate-binding protein
VRRRHASVLLAAIALAPLRALAQTRPAPYRIAFLGTSTATDYAPNLTAFLQGLRELGYEDGRNIVIEYRWAEGREERLPELAAELVHLKPDIFVTHASGVAAAKAATSTIPIVMGVSSDPVALGYVQSLARPGSNITGVTSQMVELSSKRVELLKELVPGLKEFAVLSRRNPAARDGVAQTEAAARKFGVRVRVHWLETDATDLERVFADIARARPDGLIVLPYPMTLKRADRIGELAVQHRLPSIGGGRFFIPTGGLVSYCGDFEAGWRVAARYVDRILKGATPADLPIEQPNTIELGVNLRTARALRIVIPPSLLARANEVIR